MSETATVAKAAQRRTVRKKEKHITDLWGGR
jgi:hypothetical protein